MTSRTGRREAIRMSAKRAFVPKPWPLSRIARRMPVTPNCGREGRKRVLLLSSGLADRRADHQLENLVLAEARFPSCSDIVIGHFVRAQRNFLNQRPHRFYRFDVVERRAPLRARRLTVSLKNPRRQCFARFADV